MPLSKLPHPTSRCDNRTAHDIKDNCDNNDGINIGSDRGDDGMHPTFFPITQNNGEGGEVLALAEVTPHRTRSGMGAYDEVAAANNKLMSYWDSPEAAILFGFNYHNKEDVFT